MRLHTARASGWSERRPGLAAVEAALVLPLIVLLLLGTWEVGRMTESSQIMNNATREAGRQASTAVVGYDTIASVIANDMTQAGITNLNGLTVGVTNLTTGDTGPRTHGPNIADYDPRNASQNDQIEIVISLPFDDVRWGPRLISTGGTRITNRTIWVCLKDQDYPNTVTVPDGF